MKIRMCFLTTVVASAILLVSCASSGSISSNNKNHEKPDFDNIIGKTWQLVKVETESNKNIELDRNQMNTMNQGNMFTLLFTNDKISGKAAPNNYFGQIIDQADGKIVFGQIAATKMALITDIKNISLNEDEYFHLLQNTFSWGITDNCLILYTANNANEKVKLIYSSN